MKVTHPDKSYSGPVYSGGAIISFARGTASLGDDTRPAIVRSLRQRGFTVEPDGDDGPFDSVKASVPQIRKHLADASPEEAARVIAVERARGDAARKTVLALAPSGD